MAACDADAAKQLSLHNKASADMEELYEGKDNKINTGIPGERIGMYDCRMSEV